MGTVHVVPVFGDRDEKVVQYWVYSFRKNGRFAGAYCCMSEDDAHKNARWQRIRERQRAAEKEGAV
jgi:hypothetical protein